ncbi:unnamed protein product [Meloidogyne enterolobii]|uniref:Uncharacterized protein n=1 Tax=Meloidogyne enterolobii TaxID=390850 RepID=A0ACB0YJ29_MELEN
MLGSYSIFVNLNVSPYLLFLTIKSIQGLFFKFQNLLQIQRKSKIFILIEINVNGIFYNLLVSNQVYTSL